MPPKRAKKKPPAKKQTRLTFAPVNPSTTASSPAVNKMAPANVRYQLPTPATSSQTLTLGGEGGEGEGDEGMDGMCLCFICFLIDGIGSVSVAN